MLNQIRQRRKKRKERREKRKKRKERRRKGRTRHWLGFSRPHLRLHPLSFHNPLAA